MLGLKGGGICGFRVSGLGGICGFSRSSVEDGLIRRLNFEFSEIFSLKYRKDSGFSSPPTSAIPLLEPSAALFFERPGYSAEGSGVYQSIISGVPCVTCVRHVTVLLGVVSILHLLSCDTTIKKLSNLIQYVT